MGGDGEKKPKANNLEAESLTGQEKAAAEFRKVREK